MRIVHIITGLSTGGAEMMLFKLLAKLNREHLEPAVVSLIDHGTLGGRIEALGIPVHSINMEPGKPTPLSIYRLVHKVHQLRPDLIQGWMYHGDLAAQFARLFLPKKNVPVVWNIRQSLYSLDYEKSTTAAIIRLCAKISPLANKIIYNSKISAHHHQKIGFCVDKTVVVPNGFDTDLFVPSAEAMKSVRSELNVSDNTILIGLIGRYHPMKDHNNFLQAAALLLKQTCHITVHFVLAGKEVDNQNQSLDRLIHELGLTEQVHLLGERHDIPRLTAALDIASCSSYTESFPNVIGEAMSCGVPCVVTDVGDANWIVGNTGRVVPPQSPHLMAQGWKELIDLGSKRKSLGEAARSRIMEYFSLNSVVSQYESLYNTVLARKPS